MSLRLTPASKDWYQPPSAEQSPVDKEKYRDVYELSVAVTSHMEGFLRAATAHLVNTDPSPSKEFIQAWKESFEECLRKFQVNDAELEEDSNAEDGQDGHSPASKETTNGSTLLRG